MMIIMVMTMLLMVTMMVTANTGVGDVRLIMWQKSLNLDNFQCFGIYNGSEDEDNDGDQQADLHQGGQGLQY